MLVFSTDRDKWYLRSQSLRMARASQDGGFRVGSLPPGSYYVLAIDDSNEALADDAWQEPGTRRQAFYNDLRPGRYRFRVIASNNDGLWNEQGAALDLVIAPAWYQTHAFWALCILVTAVAVWTLYQLRIRQVARSLNARFDERLAERTRVAREIHDTLLQTVQGSKMVADNALNHSDDADGMRHAMQQVSGWLGQASAEGRAAVSALRSSSTEGNDLAEALQVLRVEVEHRRAVAENAGVHVDDYVAAGFFLGHLVNPLLRLADVDLDAQA